MKTLIAKLDENAGKKPYQVFHLRCGLDITSVVVPLAEAHLFETALTKSKATQMNELLELSEAFGGKVLEN